MNSLLALVFVVAGVALVEARPPKTCTDDWDFVNANARDFSFKASEIVIEGAEPIRGLDARIQLTSDDKLTLSRDVFDKVKAIFRVLEGGSGRRMLPCDVGKDIVVKVCAAGKHEWRLSGEDVLKDGSGTYCDFQVKDDKALSENTILLPRKFLEGRCEVYDKRKKAAASSRKQR